MNRQQASLLLAALLLTTLTAACSDDDDDDGGMTQAGTVELRYDGDNFSSPNLPAATWQAAARFTPALTAPAAGGQLSEVRFFVQSLPTSCRVKVYDAGTASSPGTPLYEADVLADLQLGWNTHVLQSPVAVSGGDLWIAIEFTHGAPQRVIGCDAGPADPDGDWLYASTDASWLRFAQRFSDSINWNIRGIVNVGN